VTRISPKRLEKGPTRAAAFDSKCGATIAVADHAECSNEAEERPPPPRRPGKEEGGREARWAIPDVAKHRTTQLVAAAGAHRGP
jgi:hypothetical protein